MRQQIAVPQSQFRLGFLPKIHPEGKLSLLQGISKDTIGTKTERGYAIDIKNLSSEVTLENREVAMIGGYLSAHRTPG